MVIKIYRLFKPYIRPFSFIILSSIFLSIFFIALYTIFSGNIPFWYDPARDLLAGWDNLRKITLIGPTSGIPGIFYGPYWIWLLSFGLLFSKDPRVVTFIAQFLPYFIVFPFILWQFRSIFTKSIIFALWIFFMLADGIGYATGMWNPHLAPLLFLIDIYLLTFAKERKLFYLLSGIITGLILNFHISFGIGALFGICLFFLWDTVIVFTHNDKKRYQKITYLFCHIFFAIGFILAFIPTLFFETRHGFHQLQALLHTFLQYGNVVGLKGLTKEQILLAYFGRSANLLHVPLFVGIAVTVLSLAYLLFIILRVKKSSEELRLFLLVITNFIGVLCIYLTAKNPVWEYHFIATEISFLFLLGIIAKRIKVIKMLLVIWAIALSCNWIILSITHFADSQYSSPTLRTKEHIVMTIAKDADDQQYTVFDYSPSIYTYDFSYLFLWRLNKEIPYDPNLLPKDTPIIYLIIPPTSQATISDFINYRTPTASYKTVKEWGIPDGTTIIKRVRINSSST